MSPPRLHRGECRIDLLHWMWNRCQDREITAANAAISRTQQEHQSARDRADSRLEALMLVNAAIWEIVREKMSVSDADLMTKDVPVLRRATRARWSISIRAVTRREGRRSIAARNAMCLGPASLSRAAPHLARTRHEPGVRPGSPPGSGQGRRPRV